MKDNGTRFLLYIIPICQAQPCLNLHGVAEVTAVDANRHPAGIDCRHRIYQHLCGGCCLHGTLGRLGNMAGVLTKAIGSKQQQTDKRDKNLHPVHTF